MLPPSVFRRDSFDFGQILRHDAAMITQDMSQQLYTDTAPKLPMGFMTLRHASCRPAHMATHYHTYCLATARDDDARLPDTDRAHTTTLDAYDKYKTPA